MSGAATGEAHVVRSLNRFDLDDVGAKIGQGSRGHRTGPPGGAVDDPDVGQREPPTIGAGSTIFCTGSAASRRGCILSPGPPDRSVVLAETWSGGERSGGEPRDPIRNTGLDEWTGGIRHEDAAGDGLLEMGDGRSVEEAAGIRTRRPLPGSPRWCAAWCPGERRTGTPPVGEIAWRPEEGRGPPARSGRSIMSKKSWNCWALFVVTTKYPSRVGSIEGTSIVLPVPVISGHPAKEANTRVRDHGHRHAVEHRDIDKLPMATAKGLTKRQSPPRLIGARRPFAQAAAGGQGRLLGEATLTDGSHAACKMNSVLGRPAQGRRRRTA